MREVFLKALAGSAAGSVSSAAEVAGVSPHTARHWAKQDESFARLFEEARAQGEKVRLDILEREIDRRAVEGVEEPVYQGGALVGKIRRYSDNLLMFRTKRLDPAYRDRPPDTAINAGNVQIVVGSFYPGQALPAPAPALPEPEP
jgi:hypothetical protein